MNNGKIDKVSIIVSRGTLEGVYPGLIMANGARMEGIDASLFFTFFGLHAIVKKKMDHIKTAMMKKEMEKIDIPPVGEFIEMIHDAGAKIYACKATVDMFKLTPPDFCSQMDKVLTVGEFYEMSAGAQIIFT